MRTRVLIQLSHGTPHKKIVKNRVCSSGHTLHLAFRQIVLEENRGFGLEIMLLKKLFGQKVYTCLPFIETRPLFIKIIIFTSYKILDNAYVCWHQK